MKCFKADLMIRSGQQFKFTVDYGKHYMVSDRYPQLKDCLGNLCNLYVPKQIYRRTGKENIKPGKGQMKSKRRDLAQRRAEKLKVSPFDYSRQAVQLSHCSNG